jgi:hypothetical protein
MAESGDVDNPIVLTDLLVVAEPRDNPAACCAFGDQRAGVHQVANNNLREKITVPRGARIVPGIR